MSFDDGLILGLSLGGGGGGSESKEWVPPPDWIAVPEPDDYEAFFLIEVIDTSWVYNYNKFDALFCDYESAEVGNGSFSIDWGDGKVDTWTGDEEPDKKWDKRLYHVYNAIGQYLVKFTVTEHSNAFMGIRYNTEGYRNDTLNQLLIAKFGKSIRLAREDTYHWFRGQKKLKYVSLYETVIPAQCFYNCVTLERYDGTEGITAIGTNAFQAARMLKKIHLPECESIETYAFNSNVLLVDFSAPKLTMINESTFYNCSALKNINIPNCISIGNYGFYMCTSLRSVNIPNCTSIGNYGFQRSYNLRSIVVNQSCTFGSSCFDGCSNIFPKLW